ncbi:hypothetical protein V5799_027732 [Amblyomma americanum]|uniref:AMP-dependent synthetase/ligase domain-containing protein n=1 Tax=Amblyomma americanum TaxID=6943 RepID=A0AAQ4DEW1_AMBAM
MVNIYGMTESCGLILSQPITGKPQIGVDVGVPVTMAEVKVEDVTTGEKLGPHETGEICYRSESVVKSYYKRPKENAELVDLEGWRKSGDCGYYDDDGRFYIVGRLKQMIKCMDNQVVPAELEELLLREHAAEIAELSVVGLPHREFGEVPAAAAVLTEEGRRRDRHRLIESIKGTVGRECSLL